MIRYSLTALVCILYAIPLIRADRLPDPSSARHLPYIDGTSSTEYVSPLYLETFVNDELSGISCHASSVSSAGEGRMAAVWYAGSREGARDVALYIAFYDEIQNRWSEPEVLTGRNKSSRELNRYIKKIGNPVILDDNEKRLYLFYATVTIGGWSGTSINYKISFDHGLNWTDSRKMILSPFLNLTNNVKNKGVVLDDGSIVLPVYHEFIKKYSQVIRLWPHEKGMWYTIRKITDTHKAIQPSLLPEGEKGLIAFVRNMDSEAEKYVLVTRSDDLGLSWSELDETSLPHPNSGLDMIRLQDGSYLGVINKSFEDRSNLTLVMSSDQGRTWRDIKMLEDNPGREYSYPAITRNKNGRYHLTYTFERKRIKHVVFNEEWIKAQADAD